MRCTNFWRSRCQQRDLFPSIWWQSSGRISKDFIHQMSTQILCQNKSSFVQGIHPLQRDFSKDGLSKVSWKTSWPHLPTLSWHCSVLRKKACRLKESEIQLPIVNEEIEGYSSVETVKKQHNSKILVKSAEYFDFTPQRSLNLGSQWSGRQQTKRVTTLITTISLRIICRWSSLFVPTTIMFDKSHRMVETSKP